jgi:threonine synthase
LVSRKPRIVCAQAEAANPLYLSFLRDFRVFEPIAARPTLASAIQIGNPVSIEKAIDAIRRYDGIVEQASEQEIAEACAQADRTGLFNCPHTGVALAATAKLVDRGIIRPQDRVVVISTAHGLKFVDFKVKYHSMTLDGITSELPNPPIELPARYETVRDEMRRQIDVRAAAGPGGPRRPPRR